MTAIAFLFPGQGAQSVGMGRDIAEAWPEAREIFDIVDEALDEKLSSLIWEGPQDELTLTRNAQPALMATSLAAMRALEAEGVPVTVADFVAGHSLGEYSALAAAGALDIAEAARLLRLRGEAMQAAVPVGEGAMAAILGLDLPTVEEIAALAGQGEVCEAANDNDPAQIVISGHKGAVERAVELAKERGAKRAVMLPVSAPFHSALMEPAAQRMAEALSTARIEAPAVPLVANVTAAPVTDPEEIRRLLVDQVTGRVRWRESVARMAEEGVGLAAEVGSGKALSGMVRRISRQIECVPTGNAEGVRKAAARIRDEIEKKGQDNV